MKKVIVFLGLFLLMMTGCNNTLATPTEKVEEFLGKYQSMDSEVLAQLDSVISDDTSMSDEQKKDYRALMEKQYQNLAYKIKDENIDGDTATVDVEIEIYDYATSIAEARDYYTQHEDEFKDKTEPTIDIDGDNDNSNNTNNNVRNNNDNTNNNNTNNTNNNARDNNTANNNNGTTNNNIVGNNDADNSNDATNNNNTIGSNNNSIKEDSKYIDYKIKQLKKVTNKVKYEITFNLTKKGNEWVVEDISDIDRQKIHGLFEE